MTSTRRLMRFGVGAAAVAVLCAGIACASVNRREQTADSAGNRERVKISDDEDAHQLLDWLSTRSMPKLDRARALREMGELSLISPDSSLEPMMPLQLQMPKVTDFNAAFRGDRLATQPSTLETDRAGIRLSHSLELQFRHGVAPLPPLLPLLNPLG